LLRAGSKDTNTKTKAARVSQMYRGVPPMPVMGTWQEGRKVVPKCRPGVMSTCRAAPARAPTTCRDGGMCVWGGGEGMCMHAAGGDSRETTVPEMHAVLAGCSMPGTSTEPLAECTDQPGWQASRTARRGRESTWAMM
jgi:hypothetical protein